MTELRTLKDFKYGKVIRCNDCEFSADELKEEAIKIIKFYRESGMGIDSFDWLKIFKDFFDIKQEDLQ